MLLLLRGVFRLRRTVCHRLSVYRRQRERDPACKIILVDDTQEFAIRGMRLHCTDFILRPVEFRHIVRSMNLALRGWQ